MPLVLLPRAFVFLFFITKGLVIEYHWLAAIMSFAIGGVVGACLCYIIVKISKCVVSCINVKMSKISFAFSYIVVLA